MIKFRVAFLSTNNNFATHIIKSMKKKHEVCLLKSVNPKLDRIASLLNWADLVYVEWCDKLLKLAIELRPDKPIVARLHKYELFTRYMYEIDFSKVDLLIYNIASTHTRELFHEICETKPKREVILPDGVDLDLFSFNEHRDFKPPYQCCIVGRVYPNKGQYELIRMWADLDDPDFHLNIVGKPVDGMYYRNCVDLVDVLELRGRVSFTHRMARPCLADFLRTQHIIISNSRDEGNHTVVKEAMATGCYPLLNCWRGVYETYPRWTPFHTEKEFISQLKGWKRYKDKSKLAREARAFITTKYDVKVSALKIVKECEKVYRRCRR